MLHAIAIWMMAGSPAHYMTILGILAYAGLEWWLPRTKVFAANSTIELAANTAKKALLDRIPLLGRLVKALATPAALLLAFALAVSGCAGLKAQAKADGISESKLIFQDIVADAPEVGGCALKTAATVGAVWAGNLAAFATGAITDIACFYTAAKEILAQLAAPDALPLPKASLVTAKSVHLLIKTALALKPVSP